MTKAQALDLVRKWPKRAAKRLVELSKENEKLRAQVARLQKQLTESKVQPTQPGPWHFDAKFLNQQQFAGLWTASVPVYVGCEEKEGSRRPSSTGT